MSPAFTYQVFDALSGGFIGESVEAPQGVSIAAMRASIALHVRAVGAPDLDADGGVTPADFTILAGNYGAAVDPETGALLEADPTLAAAPTGDVNGDGVVDGDDLMEVVTGIGSNGTLGYEDGSGLTEAEAGVVQGAFAAATAGRLDCVHCALCHLGWCQVLPPEMEEDGPDPDTEPGDDGVTLPPGGGPPGSGGPGPNHPDGDENLDGILNKHDCLWAHFAGNPLACDTNSNGIPDTGDCGSCLFVGDISQCDCGDVDIAFTPGCSERTPNYVWMIPEGQLPKVVTIRACAGPPGGYYQWLPLHSEVAEYEPGQDLTSSSMRVRLKKGGNFWATCTYVAEIDGDLCQVHFEQFAGAVVHSVKLESVEFAGGLRSRGRCDLHDAVAQDARR